MADFKDWSDGWLKEGQNLSYHLGGVTYYERILQRDLAHYEWPWAWQSGTATPTAINATSESGPFLPPYLEVTRGYDEDTATNHIWQVIFGIKGQVYVYLELPTDLKRHGLPKLRWPNEQVREIAHFEEYMSPYNEPTFLTEHFMKRLETYMIEFTVYNPNSIAMRNVWLNFLVAKLKTERLGTQKYTAAGLELKPTRNQFKEILDKLYKRTVPCRPITILPVRAPAEAPAGQ